MEVLTNLIVVIIFHSIYMHQNITLYTFNLYSVICQLYLSKAGKKSFGETTEMHSYIFQKRNENVYSSSICNSSKLETTRMSISCTMDK